MVVALSPNEKHVWIPPGEESKPKSLQTHFTWRDLTEAERMDIADHAYVQDSGGVRNCRGTQTLKALRYALTGTEPGFPLRDVDPKTGVVSEVQFEMDLSPQVTDAYLRKLPVDLQMILANHIIEKATLTALDLEKSALSQFRSGTQGSPTAQATAGAEVPGDAPPTADQGELLDLG